MRLSPEEASIDGNGTMRMNSANHGIDSPIGKQALRSPAGHHGVRRRRVSRWGAVLAALLLGCAAGCNNMSRDQFSALKSADDARAAAKSVRALCPGAKAQADAADQAANDADAAAEALHSATFDANKAQKDYLT